MRVNNIFVFFQAEDGIRDIGVTGVQTCALPISDHETHETVETRRAVHDLIEDLQGESDRDLAPLALLLDEPPESERQLEVWRETGSVQEVARDVAERTRATAE